MRPDAPPRLSTTNCWPRSSDSPAATRHPPKSEAPPGGKGMMSRTGRSGYSPPQAAAALHNAHVSRKQRKNVAVIVTPCPLVVLMAKPPPRNNRVVPRPPFESSFNSFQNVELYWRDIH